MSAFGGKADMTIGRCPLWWSLSGVSRHGLLHRICLLLTQSGHWQLFPQGPIDPFISRKQIAWGAPLLEISETPLTP
jgi:hypothetical protein